MYSVHLPEERSGPPPPLADNERWLVELAANRTQGKRAVGGALRLTNKRLLFTPNLVESKLGGKPWSCVCPDIVSVGITHRRYSLFELFSGGLVDRLRIDLRNGRTELFVVSDPAQRAAEFRELLNVPEPGGKLPVARVLE